VVAFAVVVVGLAVVVVAIVVVGAVVVVAIVVVVVDVVVVVVVVVSPVTVNCAVPTSCVCCFRSTQKATTTYGAGVVPGQTCKLPERVGPSELPSCEDASFASVKNQSTQLARAKPKGTSCDPLTVVPTGPDVGLIEKGPG